MQPAKLSHNGRRLFEVIEFDENERLLAEIRKHPFGLYLIYLSGIFVSLLILAVLLGLSYVAGQSNSDNASLQGLMILGGVVISVAVLGVTFIAGYLYNSNVIIVTNEKLAQVLYASLFNRKISQLSIGDVQDVTVQQNGIFPHWFNYGTIVIETAGEQQNYTFTYAPNPYEASKTIVSAHEINLKEFGN